MIWGIKDNQRIIASPKDRAICELCKQELIAKCGEIKIWHWAHKSKIECDSWWEPENEWHINWKNEFPKEQQEITIGIHRADIKNSKGVIELQNSSISPEDIFNREEFYRQMIWLINGEKFAENLEIRQKEEVVTFRWKSPPKSWWFAKKPIYIDLSKKIYLLKNKLKEYKNGKRDYKTISEEVGNDYGDGTHWESQKIEITNLNIKKIKIQIKLLSTNDSILFIKKLYTNIPCGGWGYLINKESFLKIFKEDENENTKNTSK